MDVTWSVVVLSLRCLCHLLTGLQQDVELSESARFSEYDAVYRLATALARALQSNQGSSTQFNELLAAPLNQEELQLPRDAEAPLIAFIGRLDPQKGADILLQAAQQILPHNRVQLVCLGTGDKSLEDGLRWLENQYYDKARCWVGFNEPFSHRLTAAADIVLMPSRFEPCGLNQLYAMRYGAVPVAHKTGGLKDTVIDFDPWTQTGTGWTYTNCDAQGLSWAIGNALNTWWHHREDFRGLQRRGMQRDSSWDLAAQQYELCMNWASVDAPYCK